MPLSRAPRLAASLLGALAAVGTAGAQALVTGTLRDSISGRPFANATVELVPALAPWLAGFSTRSDSSGRYSIPEVPPGKYLFGFLHPRLDSLGMDQVTRTIDVKPAQHRVSADLALPSARTLAAMLCDTRRDNAGVLLGRVYDARSGEPVGRGTVLVRWGELSMASTGLRNDAAQRTATVHDDGRFIACDVPTDAPLEVQAIGGNLADPSWVAPRVTSGLVELQFTYDMPLLHRDFYVALRTAASATASDSAAERASRTARLVGHIIADDGRAVANARVLVREAGAETVTDTSGSFRIANLPLGTQNVELVALGYAPMRMAVDLRPNADAVALFHPSRRAQRLEEVEVLDGVDHTGFERRRRQGTGYFLTATAIAQREAISLPMLLSSVPALRVGGLDAAGRPLVLGRGNCTPAVYLDGQLLRDGMTQASGLAQPRDIGGIEVYTTPADTPPQFAGLPRNVVFDPAWRDRGSPSAGGTCATIVIWSRGTLR